MKLQINLIQQVILQSMYCHREPGENCAIANAIRDIFPDAIIGNEKIYFKKYKSKPFDYLLNAKDETIDLPLAAILFISEFDSLVPEKRAQMAPVSFEINVPDSLIDDIDISEIEEILKTSLTLQFA